MILDGESSLRPSISLDGSWQFQIDPAGTYALDQITAWRTITVPGPWQARFDDLRLTAGVGWYRRTVDVPADWSGRAVFLCFGAVDYYAEVWVNGRCAGDHEGGYLPFEFDVSALLHYGAANEIVVRVVDPGPDEGDRFPAFPFAEIPNGKQRWYGPLGGIWQSVSLEARSLRYVRQVHVTPQGLDGSVTVAVELAGEGSGGHVRLDFHTPQGEPVIYAERDIPAGENTARFAFSIPQPALWSPESPALYTLIVTLQQGRSTVDRQAVRFGLRTIEVRDGRLWLNGRLLYLRVALDQYYYPEGICTPPSLDFLKEQVRAAKAMGLNCLRCHIKIADPRYLQAADEEGILVWAEVPSWWTLTDAAGRRARETFAGMVARDWNHPSVVIWTLVNENWGTNLPGSSRDRAWLAETYAWARTVDPTRLIVDNSACLGNFHVHSDLDDFHFYAAMPENMDLWQDFVTNFARRPDWTYSPHGDAVRTGQEPLIVSEFGNWGLPDLAKLRAAYDGDPWWFDTGAEWNPGVVLPRGAEERFTAAGLDRVFGDWFALAQAAQWAEYRALKHEIEVMRAEPSICGYVITEWTDAHWECNGLQDMARHPRVFADRMPAFNADTVIVPRWDRLVYWSGETVTLPLCVSHWGSDAIDAATLHWSLDKMGIGGVLAVKGLLPGTVIQAGSPEFTAPPVAGAVCASLSLQLELHDGQIVAQNTLPITLLPAAFQNALERLPVWANDAALADWLCGHGYTLDRERGLWVVSHLDEEALRHVQDGGRALLIATEPGVLPGLPGVTVQAREHTPWDGNWASSFAWAGPGLTRLPGGPLLDFAWRGAFPKHVITGIPAENWVAGLFVGWVHMAAALAARLPLESGMLTVATFPVLPPGDSPVRTLLLHDLIRAAFA
jgi:beta-galactosidase/beta-glucuronidase